MKHSQWTIIAAVAVGLAAGYLLNQSTPAAAQFTTTNSTDPVAPYVLLSAEYEVAVDGSPENMQRRGLFRMNTETGKTWRYQERVNKKGYRIRAWLEIE